MGFRRSASRAGDLDDAPMKCWPTGPMTPRRRFASRCENGALLRGFAKRNTEHGSGLGRFRYVVEAAFDWLFNQRRLRIRYEKRDDIHLAFLIIGCFLICWRRIRQIMGFC